MTRTRYAKILLISAMLLLGGCKSELYSDLSEQEANEIISILFRYQIDAARETTKGGSVTVLVEQNRFADAVEILGEQGYPKQDYATLGDVFQGDGFVVSPMEERARFVFAMSEELSRTVSDIDGVISARTHVVLPTSDRFSQDKTPSSASVFVRHEATFDLQPLVPQIKLLVANSIEGLTYEKVTVVLVPVEVKSDLLLAATSQSSRVSTLKAGFMGAGGVMLLAGLALGGFLVFRRVRKGEKSLVTIPVPRA